MKKRLIATAVVSGLLVAPYFAGKLAQTEMENMLAKMQNLPNATVSIENYHRGWFSSTADIVATISQDLPEQVEPLQITLTSKQILQHGPILWQSNGLGFGLVDIDYNFDIAHNQNDTLEFNHTFSKDKLDSYVRIGFTGTMTSSMNLQAFQVSTEQGTFDIHAMNIDSSMTKDGQLQFSGDWQGLDFSEFDDKVLSIGKMQFSADQQVVRGDLLSYNALTVGDSNFTLASLDILGPIESEKISMKDLNVISTSHEKDGLMYADADITVANINAVGQEFKDFSYLVSFNKLDLDVYQEFQNVLVSNNAQQDPNHMIMQIQALLPKLLAAGPELKIKKLGMQTEQGEIASQLNIEFDQDLLDANNPMTIIMALKADANGKAPVEFFNAIGMQQNIEALIMQNMLVADEAEVKFDFTFANGQALINGMPIPLG
ncbi:YdgA family protein [Thalassotalea psychrophila]|uniref:YdgA family protein n=1 Tax=Thalassotalea psychrophila TaxID=3065647 RepID=A0ABY9TU21_9GAMM|nr:YdgA family protein [Colwelliaceae bacterium SQ149]